MRDDYGIRAPISAAGGLLSHAAIVARECNIPAVVSVRGPNALTDGTLVSIDGWGEVSIIQR
ncbi:MAG: PEP-utilizing enzyme [Halobacteriota archaeon]